MPRATTRKGVVIGDFSPVINAHVYMIDFARRFVDDLTIVVDAHAKDSIPADVRVGWLKELFPACKVVTVTSKIWHKSDDADFSDGLVRGLRKLLPKSGGYLFCLEKRGQLLAERLNAMFMPLDALHAGHTIGEQHIRSNPLEHWDALPRVVRPYFVKRVCIFGPESTGKSTLARQLAERFNTIAVPEYAKTYIEQTGREIDSDDMVSIARAQVASEDALARDANRVLFCDSDLVTSFIWSGRLVGDIPEWLRLEANKRQYDLYLLADIDVPWVDDVHRYLSEDRQSFFDKCILELTARKRRYVHIKGGWDERFEDAVKAVQTLISA